MAIACEAIDRLHTTASSHHRCMLVDVMGHNTGWLALGAGLAGGADVILIPEMPFFEEEIMSALQRRESQHKRFSIVVVAEGAMSHEEFLFRQDLSKTDWKKRDLKYGEKVTRNLGKLIEQRVGIETRITTLGHLQRGGIPTPRDRLLASRLGTEAADLVLKGKFGYMMAVQKNGFIPVPLADVVGKKKYVTADCGLIRTAKHLDVSMGIPL
jgi:6-phosphofructokinase